MNDLLSPELLSRSELAKASVAADLATLRSVIHGTFRVFLAGIFVALLMSIANASITTSAITMGMSFVPFVCTSTLGFALRSNLAWYTRRRNNQLKNRRRYLIEIARIVERHIYTFIEDTLVPLRARKYELCRLKYAITVCETDFKNCEKGKIETARATQLQTEFTDRLTLITKAIEAIDKTITEQKDSARQLRSDCMALRGLAKIVEADELLSTDAEDEALANDTVMARDTFKQISHELDNLINVTIKHQNSATEKISELTEKIRLIEILRK